MSRILGILCAVAALLVAPEPAPAQTIQDFSVDTGLWKLSPQRIGRSKVPGWKIVQRGGGQALRNSGTGSRATYYWKVAQVFDLRELESPRFVMKYDFRGHGYSSMKVLIGPRKARRLRDFTTIFEQTKSSGPQRIEIDLAEYAGEMKQIRVMLRKPRGVVEKKVGLYLYRLELASENTVDVPECKPYNRRMYRHWLDSDRDCQDTRQESLISSAAGEVTYLDKAKCRVFAGEWLDPYTGLKFDNPLYLDIDHMVPLKEAHESGAWAWDADERSAFANQLDPEGQLFAVQAAANRKKGAKDPAQWLPSQESFRKDYARAWIKVKVDWSLTADAAELAALREILGDEPGVVYPDEAPEMRCNQ